MLVTSTSRPSNIDTSRLNHRRGPGIGALLECVLIVSGIVVVLILARREGVESSLANRPAEFVNGSEFSHQIAGAEGLLATELQNVRTPAPTSPDGEVRRPVAQTPAGLRALILDEVPPLRAALEQDPLAAAQLLTSWCASHVTYAADGCTAALTAPRLSRADASELFWEIFEPGVGAVYCAGCAQFLYRTLQLFEFDVGRISIGSRADELTHDAVILRIPSRTGDEIHLLEPTFDATFIDHASGRALPLNEILARRADGSLPASVDVRLGDLSGRRYVVSLPPVAGGGSALLPIAANQRFLITAHSQHPWSAFWHSYAARLKVLGIPTGVEGYFEIFARGVTWASGSDALIHLLHDALRAGGLPPPKERRK